MFKSIKWHPKYQNLYISLQVANVSLKSFLRLINLAVLMTLYQSVNNVFVDCDQTTPTRSDQGGAGGAAAAASRGGLPGVFLQWHQVNLALHFIILKTWILTLILINLAWLFCLFSLYPHLFARAYINFKNQEDIVLFRDRFDGYVFIDNRGMRRAWNYC